jgi:DNA-binding MarR family transcriptional regulator
MKIENIIKSHQMISLNKKTLLNIMHTQSIVTESFSDLLKQYDLSSEQFNVLEILRDQNRKPANMSVIQEKMTAKTSNTTRLVDKLLLKKLVTREVCAENRRKIEVFITSKGLEILKEVDPAKRALEEKFSNNLTQKEHLGLNALLDKYKANM